MTISRRLFLQTVGAGALAVGAFCRRLPETGSSPAPGPVETDLAEAAMRRLKALGADYGDIRICSYRTQEIHAENRAFKRLADEESRGLGIRALTRGAWGFAASDLLDEGGVLAAAELAFRIAAAGAALRGRVVSMVPEETHRGRWISAYRQDPFEVPLDRKCGILLGVVETMLAVPGVFRAEAGLSFERHRKVFASTEGSFIEQEIVRSEPYARAFATEGGDTQSRGFEAYPLNIGFEHVLECGLVDNARRVGEEAVEKVRAAAGPSGRRTDLILVPSHLWLTIHESVGHPTELDRVLGYEANYAGTSFATPDLLGKLRYGSKIVNFVADRTTPHGRSTTAYDDEGVKTGRWDIVRDGVLVGYSTNRETAARLDFPRSTGCAFADSWRSVPIVRIPNLCLQPGGDDAPTVEALIADTRDGILIDGTGSYSIDQQRRNFQFGGDAFWEIRDGKKVRMLKNVTYQAMTTDFWGACDAVGRREDFRLYGTRNCGKGEPEQTGQMSHGSPPARFRGIEVGGGKS